MKTQLAQLRDAIKTLLRAVGNGNCKLSIGPAVKENKVVLKVCNPQTGAYAKTSLDGTNLKDIKPFILKGNDVLLAIGDADGGEVTISSEKGNMVLAFGKAKLKIGLVAEQQDELTESVLKVEKMEPAPECVKGKALKQAFKRVSYASAVKDVRHYLCGVFLTADEGNLTFVATNGHMMGVFKSDVKAPTGFVEAVVPITTVESLIHVLADDTEYTMAASYNDTGKTSGLCIKSDKLTVVFPVIEGAYPAWRRVIPSEETLSYAKLPRGEVLSAANRITFMAKANNTPYLRWTFGQEDLLPGLRLATTNGESFEVVNLEETPKNFEVGFTGDLLLEMLAAFTCSTIRFGFSENENAACVFKDPDSPAEVHVLMRARV